jgi:hypothetical protein
MVMEKKILYFDKPGEENTEALMRFARERAGELGIHDLVVATSHGSTALRAKEIFGRDTNVVAVTISESYWDRGWCITSEERAELESMGVTVFTGQHSLGDGVGAALSDKHGGIPPEMIIREAYYRFGQGMKVTIEIILMAADAGLIQMDREVMSIAGTGDGADTCIIVKPAYSRKFFDLEIREIVAKPRQCD